MLPQFTLTAFLGLFQYRAWTQPCHTGSFHVILLLYLAVILKAHTRLPYDFEDTLKGP